MSYELMGWQCMGQGCQALNLHVKITQQHEKVFQYTVYYVIQSGKKLCQIQSMQPLAKAKNSCSAHFHLSGPLSNVHTNN